MDEDDFKVRKFSIRIIKEGNSPPKIEISDNFDPKEMERFNKEIERIHNIMNRMLMGFGMDPAEIFKEIEQMRKNIEEPQERIDMPVFEMSRYGDELDVTVMLNRNYRLEDLNIEIERGKLVIKGQDLNIKIPIQEEFHNGKIIDRSISNRILNVVIKK
ncbi:MAG: hypothetical protein NZ908_01605 [Candidatus Micrarchaeota archaeon]|nr:hypothetical protein [Candidatus Micrarchaeota archaeon]MCX8154586.1 hypothetical protein [Candidatus Micrarchaeota archaeon]